MPAFDLAEEAEFLEQENLKASQELAQPGPNAVVIEAQAVVVKVEPVAEIAKIIEFKDRIAAYMAPALEDELKWIVKVASAIVKVTTPEEREAAAEQATKCQKGRTLKVEAQHAEFKAPVTAVGRLFDNRKTALSAIVKTEEDRIRLLIADFDKKEADRLAEIERLRKLKVSGRINDLASRGLAVDAEFAEAATDGEWELHVAGMVKEKEELDRKIREEQARKDATQKRIVDRMEIASKLGAALSRDDAEFLSEEAFEEERDKWVIAYNQREEDATKRREEANLVKRAGDAGFVLQQCDIDKMRETVAVGQFSGLEAVFMVWLGDMTKAKKDDEAKLLAAARLEKRMAQVEEFGIDAAISVLKNATDEEWDCIVAAAKPAPVVVTRAKDEPDEGTLTIITAHGDATIPFSKEKFDNASGDELREIAVAAIAPVQVADDPAPVLTQLCTPELVAAVDAGPTYADEVMVEIERIKGELLQMAAEKAVIRDELGQVFQSFKDFGNTHCLEVGQRRTDFTGLYLKLKALVERV